MKSKVDWRALLREAIREGLGKTVVTTYRRLNRKVDIFPGLKRLTMPTIWALVDVSGSVSQNELRQFFTEIYAIAKQFNSRIVVVEWDAQVQKVFEIRKPSDVRNVKVRGRGGTVIRDALEYVTNKAKYGDAVVVFSDFWIDDIASPQVKELLAKLSQKCTLIGVSTSKEPPQPFKPVKIT